MQIRRRTKVFVIGSFRPEHCEGEKARFEQACQLLGGALSEADCDLILNSERPATADPYIFKGYADNKSGNVQIFRPDPEHAEGEATRPFSNADKTWIRVKQDPRPVGTFRTSHLRSIGASDVVVAIGGSPRGTLNALGAADVLGRPVAGVTAFGGAAAQGYRDYSSYYRGDAALNELLTANPGEFDDAWAHGFAKGVVRLAKLGADS